MSDLYEKAAEAISEYTHPEDIAPAVDVVLDAVVEELRGARPRAVAMRHDNIGALRFAADHIESTFRSGSGSGGGR